MFFSVIEILEMEDVLSNFGQKTEMDKTQNIFGYFCAKLYVC